MGKQICEVSASSQLSRKKYSENLQRNFSIHNNNYKKKIKDIRMF